MKIDICVGLQYGDEAKKKCSNHLLSNGNYTHACRASGGPNCGGTLYKNGKKFILHHIPSGVFHNIKSIIGAGCALYPKTFFEEIENLEKEGYPASKLVKVAYNTHIITKEHIEEDIRTDKVGSTGRGIMPVFRDKYARVGLRAESVPELKNYICDPFEELHQTNTEILIEGGQGFYLDPDHGKHYPYVTSSPPTAPYALHSLGLPVQDVNRIYGAAKVYTTYVGTRKFQPNDPVFKQIASVGQEYGATTGRLRQCNWMDIDDLCRAIKMNGVTDLIFNKADILCSINQWGLITNGKVLRFQTEEDFQDAIFARLPVYVGSYGYQKLNITFSYSPEKI